MHTLANIAWYVFSVLCGGGFIAWANKFTDSL